jgi:pimeloyl-ACP methyl ester carboxylesterase
MAIAFDDSGSGPALVLLHGLGSRRGAWDPVVPALARERRVIALDIPGFGASPAVDAEPTVPALAEHLHGWFAEQGLERPHVAGNSMGGGIALELARRGAVASVTALSPVGFWSPRERAFCQRSLRASHAIAARLRPAVPALASTGAGRTALLAQIHARPWRLSQAEVVATVDALLGSASFDAALAAFSDYVLRDPAALRATPVTIAWGTRDALLIPRQAARARRMLPWARHVALRGCGHLPFHDDPQAVAGVLLAGSAAG